MEKIDVRKQLKHLYQPPVKEVVEVDVPPMRFIMVDGRGDPNTAQEYSDAIEALYGVAYTAKFMVKKGEIGIDYGVMPLEGLWWADDMNAFTDGKKGLWSWTAMIMQPDFVTDEVIALAIEDVRRKKNPAALDKLRLETFAEGLSAQVMHIGPFSDEAPNIMRVHEFIEAFGHKRSGKHHEIYLTDIRRAAPEKWKTIIRQPMA